MPVNTQHPGITPVSSIDSVAGFRVSGIHAGLKADGTLDMALVVSDRDCTAAGVFTTNTVQAAPVLVDQAVLRQAAGQGLRAVIVNTRCANACTGEVGIVNARAMIRMTEAALEVPAGSVLVMSTGVIGTHLNMPKIEAGIGLAVDALGQDWEAASRGIMTTDTRPKQAAVRVTTAHGVYIIAGIAKGAGMIAPNMATMLGVIVTDAAIAPALADVALRTTGQATFNRIVVDGDMSTNDTVLLLANGASGISIEAETDAYAVFVEALRTVAEHLAKAIVRDGEGMTKFITLRVTGAASDTAAHIIANTISTSPLVKTAFYGGDANWGRMVAAAGRAGVPFDPAQARLWITPEEDSLTDDVLLFEHGMPTTYDEARATAIMAAPSITAHLDCGGGVGQAVVWTCDLSHDYVSVNGHYRS